MTLYLALAAGAAAFAHCLGMCGPFALHLSGSGRWRGLLHQAMWHVGRITTYAFLGAVAGFLGGRIGGLSFLPHVQTAMSVVVGVFIALMGLSMLGVLPVRALKAPPPAASLLGRLSAALFNKPTPAGALVLGQLTALLPCPIVLGFLALSLHGASVGQGIAIMAAMGLGTTWSLLALGLAGGAIRLRLRRSLAVVGASLLILAGLATVLRATPIYHRLPGCPAHAAQAGAVQEPKPCCGSSSGQ